MMMICILIWRSIYLSVRTPSFLLICQLCQSIDCLLELSLKRSHFFTSAEINDAERISSPINSLSLVISLILLLVLIWWLCFKMWAFMEHCNFDLVFVRLLGHFPDSWLRCDGSIEDDLGHATQHEQVHLFIVCFSVLNGEVKAIEAVLDVGWLHNLQFVDSFLSKVNMVTN